MTDFSYEELKLIDRVGKALGMSNVQVMKTPFIGLIEMLVFANEQFRMANEIDVELIDAIKNLIKKWEK